MTIWKKKKKIEIILNTCWSVFVKRRDCTNAALSILTRPPFLNSIRLFSFLNMKINLRINRFWRCEKYLSQEMRRRRSHGFKKMSFISAWSSRKSVLNAKGNELNYHDQKIRRTLARDIRKHWSAVSTLLGPISSVYHDIPYWKSNQRPQNAELKLYHWAIGTHCTQVTPDQLVMVIARPINLNVSCKLHPYSLQRTWSPPGPRLPRRIGNTHLRNFYNLKGKDIIQFTI